LIPKEDQAGLNKLVHFLLALLGKGFEFEHAQQQKPVAQLFSRKIKGVVIYLRWFD
jgi:hypothetical protein